MKFGLNALLFLVVGSLGVGLVGCGGDQGPKTSTVTGSVLDKAFNPLRDATVESNRVRTQTTSTGAFALENLPAGDVEVVAEAFVNGTKYVGRTTIFNLTDTQQNNVNVIVAPENEVGVLRGTVRDRQGFLLQGASVFAYVGSGSSIRAVTNDSGEYVMRDVPPGAMTLSATGRGFRSDQTGFTLGVRQDRTVNFVLGDPGLPSMNPPAITYAYTYTSHPDATRGENGNALAWAKSKFGGSEAPQQATTRALRSDMIVEANFGWNVIRFPDLLGFNVYRGFGASGSVSAIDLSFDPLADYYVDIGLEPFTTYSYAFSTVATLYPDFNNSESNLSNRIVLNTLGLLNINAVTSGPRFSWQGGSGATEYEVYIFDRFPTGGTSEIFVRAGLTGLAYVYDGPPLQNGRTYYYIVLGIANGAESRTISQIGTFVP
ncbi:hypothetical protein C0431_03555 [bacterium]|nr:hypothetical protein [bacterium]